MKDLFIIHSGYNEQFCPFKRPQSMKYRIYGISIITMKLVDPKRFVMANLHSVYDHNAIFSSIEATYGTVIFPREFFSLFSLKMAPVNTGQNMND